MQHVSYEGQEDKSLPIEKVRRLIERNERWLVGRILEYARKRDYLKYNSTLEEAWRIAIVGLSDTLIDALHYFQKIPELGPDVNFSKDPIATFAIIEAQRHRKRGVTLSMFLGLMKYYKQSYVDLITESDLSKSEKEQGSLFIERCFDRIEIGFCTEWTGITEIQNIVELQISNRQMTNEKNKYLTIFESLHSPAILLNNENKIENLNHTAVQLIESSVALNLASSRIQTQKSSSQKISSLKSSSPGSSYYGQKGKEGLPWMQQEIQDFIASQVLEGSFEKELETSKGKRYYHIKLKKMLDVTGKYGGTVVIFDDLTERRKMERKLALMATTDSLTGLYNRGWYLTLSEKEILRSRRYHLPLSLIIADIDHFKRINDEFGHHVGDRVLKEVSALLQNQLRVADIMGRIGGEEFSITLIESDLKRAAATADRLREQIARYSIQSGSVEVRCTSSFGVTQLDGKSEDIHTILKRADDALYRAKRNGRNCIQVMT